MLTSSSSQKLVILFLLGLILIGFGTFFFKTDSFNQNNKVEILNSTAEPQEIQEITVEIAGAVEKPAVYKLPNIARVDDLLIIAGGLSANADREWVTKNVNRAAKLIDGQKYYIYQTGEVSAREMGGVTLGQSSVGGSSGGLTNINTATLSELDKLPGIGPVYGQRIIDNRIYSSMEELVSKGAITQSVFEKIKNLITL